MIVFQHHALVERNQSGKEQPPACTWDYFFLDLIPAEHRARYAQYVAFATCAHGHCCMINREVHSIGSDGTLTPSYVCPVAVCGFHEHVRLDGWSDSPSGAR
jgi:hypothetical protein